MDAQVRELNYRLIFRPEPEGGYTVIVPALPGCITYGADLEQARRMAREAIESYLDSLIHHGEAVPDDSDTLEGHLTLHHAA
ncbi:MAG: type II toxin-antitoxin system HicB family antitoxin [Thiobacillaceae bacterium]|nr:type II toxin-antitoxin system HicB family antitoxin [Thiobacillaceae bacterium]MCX7672438.1 type II toxin-antitoxin system HicB family antitoxin [Thiobacillaceae bacterium]MDW8324599.1 type II toxin-antitoxin system HicB family antitoxin [Burkholderiales bacterium]